MSQLVAAVQPMSCKPLQRTARSGRRTSGVVCQAQQQDPLLLRVARGEGGSRRVIGGTKSASSLDCQLGQAQQRTLTRDRASLCMLTEPQPPALPALDLTQAHFPPVRCRLAAEAERTPVWLMRQAGRYMAAFREYSDRLPFRERSETASIAIELSLQPWRSFQTDGVIMFSDILTPLPALGIEFDVIKGKGPLIDNPISRLEAEEGEAHGGVAGSWWPACWLASACEY